MSDEEFLGTRNFSFWKDLHLVEKNIDENNQIIDELNLNDKINSNDYKKPKIKKV